ncbi:MAG: hypothetical protein UX44_C0020G0004 [candidate division WWE3 bacterium GW2011_GWA1_46_21]|uniref:Lipid II isoglutaminyl synthase (glutamine-hydrolyzing) subunit MurT n=4 Tax=Katanobacteria TaxID=422282 RepID=A0A0G1PCN7_UNCKA|nr:MAG: hypothetical protein UX44_C0020G0004 [candidate division WWE3 bacterium GW2011_GWA1_46_21]KKU50028.1 MAG: hypothetical protein UX73_C0023G0008 [candidate division WWE3 bacterium GW2011_GWC1_47_10]KKU57101.1 MAG: hypothetical protein UX79_C0021G0002 [candidate division WWE3 bacterium GW2011_GWB1_47_11]
MMQLGINNLRFFVTLTLAKMISFLSPLLGFGNGGVWAGHVALSIYPELLKNKRINFPKGLVLVTGTNGKTTTVALIGEILTAAGFKVTRNKTGANLLNGAVSAILKDTPLFGDFTSDVGVFEVDELSLPEFLLHMSPKIIAFLNLSRDQLDRAWETDLVLDKWLKALAAAKHPLKLVADSAQPKLQPLIAQFKSLAYLFDANPAYLAKTGLKGEFNAKNVNAAVLVTHLLGVVEPVLSAALAKFAPAYGRGEVINYNGTAFTLLLAKNPAGFNQNLQSIINGDFTSPALLFMLNDEVRDGRDVSWIYDIDPALLAKACATAVVYASGRRCWDMAVRLHYAGVPVLAANVLPLPKQVVNALVASKVAQVTVLPNYSSMLALRKILTGREIPPHL